MEGILSPETMQMVVNFAPFILMGLVFYFMLYRPQKRQEKARNEMLAAVKRGEKVVTIGGIHGVVTQIGESTVTLQVADKVEMVFNRSAVNTIVPK